MDGQFLRLGLVSYSSLGTLIKEQCGHILRDYEMKHKENLNNFDGDIQGFKDFENTMQKRLNMNIEKKK